MRIHTKKKEKKRKHIVLFLIKFEAIPNIYFSLVEGVYNISFCKVQISYLKFDGSLSRKCVNGLWTEEIVLRKIILSAEKAVVRLSHLCAKGSSFIRELHNFGMIAIRRR